VGDGEDCRQDSQEKAKDCHCVGGHVYDSGSLGYAISLSSMWLAERKPTKKMSFGFHRAEIVGALVSVLIIWILSGVLVYQATVRIIDKDFDINADIMLIVAGLGVAVNVV
jgi:zinc transporter 2